jgi:hypothetical protein
MNIECTDDNIAWMETWVPLIFIEELLDVSTIEDCRRWFQYLESRADQLIAGMPPRGGKSQALLRICNELLKKLAKTDGSEFLGRVMIFLANAFPLSDPSGKSIRSYLQLRYLYLG